MFRKRLSYLVNLRPKYRNMRENMFAVGSEDNKCELFHTETRYTWF